MRPLNGPSCTTELASSGVSNGLSSRSDAVLPLTRPTLRRDWPAPVPASTETMPPRALTSRILPLPRAEMERVTPSAATVAGPL